MKRSVIIDEQAHAIVEKYMQQQSCNFNRAVNALIIKAGTDASQASQRMRNMQEQVAHIFQWVQRHEQ